MFTDNRILNAWFCGVPMIQLVDIINCCRLLRGKQSYIIALCGPQDGSTIPTPCLLSHRAELLKLSARWSANVYRNTTGVRSDQKGFKLIFADEQNKDAVSSYPKRF